MAHACIFSGALLVLMGCHSAPPAIIDTTAVDTIITDIAGTAGTIETQTVTVYETVTKLLYQASPEDRAKVEKEFGNLRNSIAYLKTLPVELARVHAVEIGKLAAEIARLQPYEVDAEKAKGQRNNLFFIALSLLLIIGFGVYAKIKGFP